MRALTQWLLGPVWHASLAATFCYVLPFSGILAIVIQAFITLRQGMQKGLVVALASCLGGVSLGFLINSLFTDVSYVEFTSDLRLGLILSLSVWLIAGFLHKWVSLVFTTQVMTVSYMVVFMILFMTNMYILPENIRQPMSENAAKVTATIVEAQNKVELQEQDQHVILSPEDINQLSNFMVHVFEVLSMYTIQMTILMLARFWQSAIFKPNGFRDEFIVVRSGYFISTVLVCLALLSILIQNVTAAYLLGGVLLIGVIWLFIAGLSLVHWVITNFNLSWLFIVIFYLTLLMPVLSGMIFALMIIAALIDGFIDLRAMIKKLNASV